MRYKSTQTHAGEIRAALRSAGYTGRQVSVRSKIYSMGSSIRVKIKDASVDPTKVIEAVKGHEHIDRDEATGEILGGGNRFVNVDTSILDGPCEFCGRRTYRKGPDGKHYCEIHMPEGKSTR